MTEILRYQSEENTAACRFHFWQNYKTIECPWQGKDEFCKQFLNRLPVTISPQGLIGLCVEIAMDSAEGVDRRNQGAMHVALYRTTRYQHQQIIQHVLQLASEGFTDRFKKDLESEIERIQDDPHNYEHGFLPVKPKIAIRPELDIMI